MCGIAGIFAYRDSAPPVDREELLRIRERMIRRGPDGAGLWASGDGRVGLAHRRLAIIDLSEGGAQPMTGADGRYVVTFNGEIYNYRELRRGLEAKGFVFRSQSDTEVLLHLYADRGARMVDALRGMFAFAIQDNVERALFLARDPFGIKPLYYADDGRTFRFASQVKALLAGGAIDLTPEPAGTVGFFVLGSVPEPYTLYRSIRSLPAGATMIVRRESGAAAPCVYHDVRQVLLNAQDATFDREQAVATLAQAARDSVGAHLVADVPVGIFLSAGIDSGTITGLAAETGAGNLQTLTLGFEEYRGTNDDEVPYAERVAALYGTTHRTEWGSRNDFVRELPAIFDAMDQPSIDGVNTFLVSRAASRAGMKVALSGIGGDELLGGYPSFHQVPRLVRALRWAARSRDLGRRMRNLARRWVGWFASPKYAGLLEYGGTYGGAYLLRRSLFMPWELDDLLDPRILRAGFDELDLVPRLNASAEELRMPHARIAAIELSWYMRNQLLRDADWAGMAHSVEIRVPLVDVALFRSLAPGIASAQCPSKADLSRAPGIALPAEVVRRAKSGFSTPVQRWVATGRKSMDRGLRGWARSVARSQMPHTQPLNAAADESRATVLVYRIGQLGDALVSIPALREIRFRHPDARIVLLTDRHPVEKGWVSAADILEPLGLVERTIGYEPRGTHYQAAQTALQLSGVLRDLRPQAIYNLAPGRSRWQRFRDGVFFRGIVGCGRYGASLPTDARSTGEDLRPAEPEWARLLRSVGDFASFQADRIVVPEAIRESALSIFTASGGTKARPMIAIGPGSKMPSKRWAKSNFVEVIARINAAFAGSQFLIFGDEHDTELGEFISTAAEANCVNLAGRFSVLQSAALLQDCTVYIGNDTGVMHLAAMVGCPCVAIFSARDQPGRWDPMGGGHTVIRRSVPCAGCMLEVCSRSDHACLARIGPDEVASAALRTIRLRMLDPTVAARVDPRRLQRASSRALADGRVG